MVWRKVCAVVVTVALLTASVPAMAQEGTPTGFQGLAQVEMILYGQVGEGAIQPRLERAELDVFGAVQTDGGSFIARINRLAQFLSGTSSNVSLVLQLNALEWMTFQQVTQGQSLVRRIESLERAFYGTVVSGPIHERLAQLTRDVWGTNRINVARQQIKAETTLRIALLTEINSAKNRVGDTVRYRVVETVIIDNNVVIPAGVEGVGKVTEVRTSGPLGRDGRVSVDWGQISAIDGTPVKITIGAAATAQNQNSAELAAGAAMAGVILLAPLGLGPLGLAAGALVSGRDHVIPVGTQFYAEVAADTTVTALSLVPALE